MRFALALIFALGCSSSSTDGTTGDTRDATPGAAKRVDAATASPVEVDAPTYDGPHVTLSLLGRYKDPSFGAVDLPALSADGTKIAMVRELDDGGRGNPNLSLVIKSATDGRDLEVIEVLPVEPRWKPDREAEVRRKLEAANQRLGAGQWKPMTRPRFDEAAIDGAAVTLEVGGLTVRARGDKLEIARGRQVIARRQLSRMLGAGPQGCPTSPRLRDASASGKIALLEFAFAGAPGCWREPRAVVIRL